ncbi:MAG: hypothetical protein KN64_14375 [Sulfurovum sp. AS07-7]|nr:MAG: hypothetical protein KN64_14375 [Sulfurovum sp. AS07-7]
MKKDLKKVSVTIAGTRYEFALEEEFAKFVLDIFNKNDIFIDQDNRPDKLLKAFLIISKEYFEYEENIKALMDEIE